MRKLFAGPFAVLVSLAMLVGIAIPAGATSPNPAPGTITDIVAASGGTFDQKHGDFDILLTAVQAAGLAGALADPNANLTVFAPNDASFIRTAQNLGFTGNDEAGAWNFLVGAFTNLGGGDPIPVLKNVLLYHVVSGRLSALRVLFSSHITTLLGESFGVQGTRLVDKDPDLVNPRLKFGSLNIKASNGVIHVINRVLIPVDVP